MPCLGGDEGGAGAEQHQEGIGGESKVGFLERCLITDALHDSCALEAIWRLIEGAHKCTRMFIDLMP